MNIEIDNKSIIRYEIAKNKDGAATSTDNYLNLSNKPKINNVELRNNKTLEELGIQPKGNYLIEEELNEAIKDFATKEYVENEIATFDFIKVVDALPETGLDNRIYFVPKADAQTQDLFDEFVWINGAWEWITTKQIDVDLTSYVKNTDYATTAVGGVVKLNPSYGINRNTANNNLYINAATNAEIDTKSSIYKPIVPSTLDYAVKSVVGGHITLTQAEYDALTTKDENTYYYIVEE